MLMLALAIAAADLPPRPMIVEVVRDPITDEMRASAVLRDDGNRLVVSCETQDDRGPEISFHSRRWLGAGNPLTGRRALTHRFDRQPPRRSGWEIDDRRASLTGSRRVARFIEGLSTAQRLVIRARDMEERLFDAIFELNNAGPAIEQALATCARYAEDGS